MDYCRYRSAIGTPQIMSECISWPILIAILGAAFGLLFIALLVGCLLTHGSERRRRDDTDGLPVFPENEIHAGSFDCAPHSVEIVSHRPSISALEILHGGEPDM